MATFLDLDDYLLVMILLELDVADVLNARKICASVNQASKAKVLWLNILRTLASLESITLPLYIRPIESLRRTEIEAIVLRTRRLTQLYSEREIFPQRIVSLDLPQSVDWLKLVSGRWLFVASSDRFVSKFSCWDMSLSTKGATNPLAECFLPDTVNSGKAEVQDQGVVIALGLGSHLSTVHILTLTRQGEGRAECIFNQVRQLTGFSHVQLLHGDFIVCGLRNDMAIPHLINWMSHSEYPLAAKPRTEGSFLTLSIWHNYLLAFNDLCLTIYGLPSSEKQTLLPLQTIQYNVSRRVRELVEVQAIDTTTKLLVAFTSDMVFAIDLAADFTSTESNSTTPFIMILKLISINEMSYNDESQWYSLLAGSSGYRILWMSSLEDANLRYEPVTVTLTLLSATLSGLSRDDGEDFTKDEQHFHDRLKLAWQPSAPVALTAFPRLDFDDALGLVVMGNMYGELALVDYVGVRLEEIWSISQDISGCPGGSWDLNPVPVDPIPLSPIPEWIPMQFEESPTPPFSSAVGPWPYISTPAKVPAGYITDWSTWRFWLDWQGIPGDQAWLIEHAYGVLGKAKPLAYQSSSDERVLFMAGGIYFLLDLTNEELPTLSCYSADTQWDDIVDGSAQILRRLPAYRRQAREQELAYGCLNSRDRRQGRNRWIEQRERGGRPHERLLATIEELEAARSLL